MINDELRISADEHNALGTAKNSPLWGLIVRSLDLTEEREVEAALSENITAETRTFNAGRASAIKEFKRMLLNLQSETEGWGLDK
jgi:hypothetical protein